MCSISEPEASASSPPAEFDFDSIHEQLQLKTQREQQAIKTMTEKKAEPASVVDPAPVVNLVAKPMRLLKREQPRRPRLDSELSDEARRLEEMTLDERRANYDKIRERIFNSQNSEDARPEETKSEKPKKKKEPAPAEIVVKKVEEKVHVEPPNEVMVETINHLTYVQMLSDHTPPNMMRPPPPLPQSSMRIMSGRMHQQPPSGPPPLHYGAPSAHPPPTSVHDFSQPPPMHHPMYPPMSTYMPPQSHYGSMPFASNNPPNLMQQQAPPPMNSGYGGPPQPLRDCFPPLSATFFPPPNVQFNPKTPPKKRGTNSRNVNQPRK